MRIGDLPDLPSGTTGALVPCTYNGADYKTTLDDTPIGYQIGYVDDPSARDNITLNSGGYARINVPSNFPTGAIPINVSARAWTSSNGISIIVYGDTGAYIWGPANATVTGLKCRWWYYLPLT